MTNTVVITDTHFGVKNENDIYLEKYQEFLKDFFKFIEENNIKKVYHLGDLVDNRKHASSKLISWISEYWFSPLNALNIETYYIVGNHDTFYKNTNNPNWISVLTKMNKGNHHLIIDDIEYDNNIMFVPWVAPDIHDNIVSTIKSQSKGKIVLGHFDIQGMLMFGNTISTHGFSQSMFKDAKKVLSGHYHKKSVNGNIEYLGSPLPFNWAESIDEHGWHVLDTKTGKTTFYPWYNNLYGVYNDNNYHEYKGEPFVKLIVSENTGEIQLKEMTKAINTSNMSVVKKTVINDSDDNADVDIAMVGDVDTAITDYINANYSKETLDMFKKLKEVV